MPPQEELSSVGTGGGGLGAPCWELSDPRPWVKQQEQQVGPQPILRDGTDRPALPRGTRPVVCRMLVPQGLGRPDPSPTRAWCRDNLGLMHTHLLQLWGCNPSLPPPLPEPLYGSSRVASRSFSQSHLVSPTPGSHVPAELPCDPKGVLQCRGEGTGQPEGLPLTLWEWPSCLPNRLHP